MVTWEQIKSELPTTKIRQPKKENRTLPADTAELHQYVYSLPEGERGMFLGPLPRSMAAPDGTRRQITRDGLIKYYPLRQFTDEDQLLAWQWVYHLRHNEKMSIRMIQKTLADKGIRRSVGWISHMLRIQVWRCTRCGDVHSRYTEQ